MCDSLLFVNGGRIVHHGDAESLKMGSDAAGGVFYDVQAAERPESIHDWTTLNPDVEFIESRKKGGRIRINSNEPAKTAEVLARMIREGIQITEFHREERNLEDAFIDILSRIDEGKPALEVQNQEK